MTTHTTLSAPTPDQGSYSTLAAHHSPAPTRLNCNKGSLITHHSSLITALLIYRSAIRTPRKALKT